MESNGSQPPREHVDSHGDPSTPPPPSEQPEHPQVPATPSPPPAVAPFPIVSPGQQGSSHQRSAQDDIPQGPPGYFEHALAAFWEIPGDDRFPHPPGIQPVNCAWAQTTLETINCRGTLFLVPLYVLSMSQYWISLLTTHVRPATGWPVHEVRPEIFAILLHVSALSCSLEGIEPGINLCMLFSALWLAETWGMTPVVERLELSLYRYIIRRILHRNPHESDRHTVMDSNYFVFRATELYRAWQFATYVPGMADHLKPQEIARLYYYTIPCDIWPALGDNNILFLFEIQAFKTLDASNPKQDFRDYFVKSFVRAGYLTNEWPSQVEPDKWHYLAYNILIQQGLVYNAFSQVMDEAMRNPAFKFPTAPDSHMTSDAAFASDPPSVPDAPPASDGPAVPDGPAAPDGPVAPETSNLPGTAFTGDAPSNAPPDHTGDEYPERFERDFYYMIGKDMEGLPARLVNSAEYSIRLTDPLPSGPPPVVPGDTSVDAASSDSPPVADEDIPVLRLPVVTGPVNIGADGARVEATPVTVHLPLTGNFAQDFRRAMALASSPEIREHLTGHSPLYTTAEAEEETAEPSEEPSGNYTLSAIDEDFD
ncbi:hypothetical protein LIA77_10960 [Sarocladium implicatum]|nr:hypothetical protein LIA77_10960 [Sarocladium implicatum]